MAGMNAHTGHAIDGIDHIRQSVTDILTTPIGSRVMRRDYGSLLPELIDQPLNDVTLMLAYSAVVTALIRWEPRIRVERIVRLVNSARPSSVVLEADIVRLDTSTPERARLEFNLPTGVTA
ncbi:baseplate assembly protein [Alkalilimnicola ehrlichii]|uniref:Baseplate assembly protein n=1 Tax=Alkalilimnicola ehrlichii TaxID=351052 RepID=A0A3E0X3W0_9GAMM|nr:GPW/gp25 family protein [Alkalilimnicola ehrlichii]RFA31332.1 baseplate assembly protein [Alkalilimnicola ehrlichii]RFA39394.1 baseplate assembly protein [Alkalilimnicola ehrlichii]